MRTGSRASLLGPADMPGLVELLCFMQLPDGASGEAGNRQKLLRIHRSDGKRAEAAVEGGRNHHEVAAAFGLKQALSQQPAHNAARGRREFQAQPQIHEKCGNQPGPPRHAALARQGSQPD